MKELKLKVPQRPHLSFSQLSMFLRCPWQYRFRYELDIKEKPKVSLSLGKGGHEALEWNTITKIETGSDRPVDEVIQRASDRMDHYLSEMPTSEYEKDVEPGGHKDKLVAATRVYMTRDAPALRPIGAEVEFNLDVNEFQDTPLEEPIRVVNGKIDLLFDDVGTQVGTDEQVRVGVTDYKYVTKRKPQSEVNLSPQLTTYAVVVKKLTGRWPTKLGFLQMHPGTTKDGPDAVPLLREPELMTPTALTARMKRLAFQFRQVERAIRNGDYYPTDNPITCSWCGYRERCQASLTNDFEAAIIREQTHQPL